MSEVAAPRDAEARFAPYRAETGGAVMIPARDDAKTSVRRLGLTNSFDYYRRFLEQLSAAPRCVIRQMRHLREPARHDQVVVGLRHDMDTEPHASVDVAAAVHDAGLTGSFYVLHTADYYGQWIDGVFRRTTEIAPMLRRIQDEFGCEVGLHNDALWVYQQHDADGAQAVVDELAWLRSEGLRIDGTAAHNSAPIYGAENFEIFKGRAAMNRAGVAFGDRWIPLQTLDEHSLRLTYEANYPTPTQRNTAKLQRYLTTRSESGVQDPVWMRSYLVDNPHSRWGADFNVWLIGRDRWVIGRWRRFRSMFVWDATIDDIGGFLRGVAAGRRVVFHVHPVYIDLPEAEALS